MILRKFHLDRRAHDLLAKGEAGDPDDLLTTKQVCEWLGVSQQWAEIHRTTGDGPAFIRVSPTRIRYRRQCVLDWLAGRTYASTAEYAQRADAGRQRQAASRRLPADISAEDDVLEAKRPRKRRRQLRIRLLTRVRKELDRELEEGAY